MILLPIGTDVRLRRRPVGNYALLAVNIGVFLLTDFVGGRAGLALKEGLLSLDATRPMLFQYLTYQFLHGDIMHLVGNMLFLWIFGNAVCDRMGSVCYILFYIAGGVFAGFVFSLGADNPILGASGAIAAVTTAFLALFPRVQITMLFWVFIFLTTFSIPSTILIVFKIILWDNILAPSLDRGAAMSNVAYSAHLGGYAFGFTVAMAMLWFNALPRNQFDLAALWSRRRRQIGWPGALDAPLARSVRVDEVKSRPIEAIPISPAEKLRIEAIDALREGRPDDAVPLHLEMVRTDPALVFPRPYQIEIANQLAQRQSHAAAADAYEAYLQAYPNAPDVYQVRLLLGLILSRYLNESERAVQMLSAALDGLTLESQRALAIDELRRAHEQLRRHADDA